MNRWLKILLVVVACLSYGLYTSRTINETDQDLTMRQLDQVSPTEEIQAEHWKRNHSYIFGWIGITVFAIVLFRKEIMNSLILIK